MKDLLIRSFDEDLSSEEKNMLDKALADSKELQEEKIELSKTRELLSGHRQAFSEGFSDKVLEKLGQNDFSTIVLRLYKGITYSGVAAIILLLIMNHYSGGNFNLESLLGIEEISGDVTALTVIGQ